MRGYKIVLLLLLCSGCASTSDSYSVKFIDSVNSATVYQNDKFAQVYSGKNIGITLLPVDISKKLSSFYIWFENKSKDTFNFSTENIIVKLQNQDINAELKSINVLTYDDAEKKIKSQNFWRGTRLTIASMMQAYGGALSQKSYNNEIQSRHIQSRQLSENKIDNLHESYLKKNTLLGGGEASGLFKLDIPTSFFKADRNQILKIMIDTPIEKAEILMRVDNKM